MRFRFWRCPPPTIPVPLPRRGAHTSPLPTALALPPAGHAPAVRPAWASAPTEILPLNGPGPLGWLTLAGRWRANAGRWMSSPHGSREC